ncbi:MAG: hypothetical protein ABIH34_06455 [Nanoarchaeota archaeon]
MMKKAVLGIILVSMFIFSVCTVVANFPELVSSVKSSDWNVDPDSVSINYFTGDMSYSVPLMGAKGRGMDYAISLGYSSDVDGTVFSENSEKQASIVGLGWNFNPGSIRVMGDAPYDHELDGKYLQLSIPGAISTIIAGQLHIGDETIKFAPIDNPYVDVTYDGTDDTFTVTSLDGTIFEFGHVRRMNEYNLQWDVGNDNPEPFDEWWTTETHQCYIEEGSDLPACAKNYQAYSLEGETIDFPYQWDISRIKDIAGNEINFHYEDIIESDDITLVKSFTVQLNCEMYESYPLERSTCVMDRYDNNCEALETEQLTADHVIASYLRLITVTSPDIIYLEDGNDIIIENWGTDMGYGIVFEYEPRIDFSETPSYDKNQGHHLCPSGFLVLETNGGKVRDEKRLKSAKLYKFEYSGGLTIEDESIIDEDGVVLLNEAELDYDYFGEGNSEKSMLRSVQFKGKNDASFPPYLFSYDPLKGVLENVLLPTGGSVSIDYESKKVDYIDGKKEIFVELPLGEMTPAGTPTSYIDVGDHVPPYHEFTTLNAIEFGGLDAYNVPLFVSGGDAYHKFYTTYFPGKNKYDRGIFSFMQFSSPTPYIEQSRQVHDVLYLDSHLYFAQMNQVGGINFEQEVKYLAKKGQYILAGMNTKLGIIDATGGWDNLNRLADLDATFGEIKGVSAADGAVYVSDKTTGVKVYDGSSWAYIGSYVPESLSEVGAVQATEEYIFVDVISNGVKYVDIFERSGSSFPSVARIENNEHAEGSFYAQGNLLFIDQGKKAYDLRSLPNVKELGDFSLVDINFIGGDIVFGPHKEISGYDDMIVFSHGSRLYAFSYIDPNEYEKGVRVKSKTLNDGFQTYITSYSYESGNWDSKRNDQFYDWNLRLSEEEPILTYSTYDYADRLGFPDTVGYNTVTIDTPGGNGKTVMNFYNDVDDSVCPSCPDLDGVEEGYALDGQLYQTMQESETDTVIAESQSRYDVQRYPFSYFDDSYPPWPTGAMGVEARIIKPVHVTSLLDGVETITESTYNYDGENGNPPNGLMRSQKITREDGSQAITYNYYAYEFQGQHTEMVPRHMLSQPGLAIVGHANSAGQEDSAFGFSLDANHHIDGLTYVSYMKGSTWHPFPQTSAVWVDKNGDDSWSGNEETYVTSFDVYDSFGRLTQFTDPKGITSKAYYEGDGDPCGEAGGDDQYSHFWLTCLKNGLQQKRTQTYDDLGNPISMKEPNDVEIMFEYDDLWRPRKMILPGDSSSDPSITFDYYYAEDNGGLSDTNPNKVRTTTKMDVNLDQDAASYADGFGKVRQTAQLESSTRTIRANTYYNELAKVSESSEPFLDPSGNLNFMSGSEPTGVGGSKVEYYNDPLSRPYKTYPDRTDSSVYSLREYGAGTVNGISGDVKMVTSTDEKGTETTQYANNLGNPLITELGDNPLLSGDLFVVEMTYLDAIDKDVDVKTSKSGTYDKNDPSTYQLTKTRYDNLGRQVSAYGEDFGIRRNLRYDANNNIIVSGDGCSNGALDDYANIPSFYGCSRHTIFGYDSLNRLKCVDFEAGNVDAWLGVCGSDHDIMYYYDSYGLGCPCPSGEITECFPVGKLIRVKDTYKGDLYETCNYYDERGQLIKEIKHISGTDYVFKYDYDNAGNLKSMIYPTEDITEYEYDKLGRMDKVSYNGVQISDYAYNADGTLEKHVYSNAHPDDSPVTTSFTYNSRNWVESIKLENVYETVNGHEFEKAFEETYKYDAVGNLHSLDETEYNLQPTKPDVRKKTEFRYDHLYRLEHALPVVVPEGEIVTGFEGYGRYFETLDYEYDLVGNLLSRNNVEFIPGYDGLGAPVGNQLEEKIINVNGRQLTAEYVYDDYGNMIEESGWQEISFGAVSSLSGDFVIHEYGGSSDAKVYTLDGENIANIDLGSVEGNSYDVAVYGESAWVVDLGTETAYKFDINGLVESFGLNVGECSEIEQPYGISMTDQNSLWIYGRANQKFFKYMKVDEVWQCGDAKSMPTAFVEEIGEDNIAHMKGMDKEGVSGFVFWMANGQNNNIYRLDLAFEEVFPASFTEIDMGGHTPNGIMVEDEDHVLVTTIDDNSVYRVIKDPAAPNNIIKVLDLGIVQPRGIDNYGGSFSGTGVKTILGVDADIYDPVTVIFDANNPTVHDASDLSSKIWEDVVVEEYHGEYGPYWSTEPGDEFKTMVKIDFPETTSNWARQYFHVYKEITTNYCFDSSDSLTSWWNDDGDCMLFEYDEAGNRIKKTVIDHDAENVIETIYLNQGNNVVYEEKNVLDTQTCAMSCD